MEKISTFVDRQKISPVRSPRSITHSASSASKPTRKVNTDAYAVLKAKLVNLYAQHDAAVAALSASPKERPPITSQGLGVVESALLSALEEKKRLAALVSELQAEVAQKTAKLSLLERLSSIKQEDDAYRAVSEDGSLHLRFAMSEEGDACRVRVLETNLPPHKELSAGAVLKFKGSAIHDFFCLVFMALNDQLIKN